MIKFKLWVPLDQGFQPGGLVPLGGSKGLAKFGFSLGPELFDFALDQGVPTMHDSRGGMGVGGA
jgi:hypothetical protein